MGKRDGGSREILRNTDGWAMMVVEVARNMDNKFVGKIIEDTKSDTPGIAMQAILLGIDKRITDERFINAVKEHKDDKICLLNVPMDYVARAALDILGAEKYNGNNAYIVNMINEWK